MMEPQNPVPFCAILPPSLCPERPIPYFQIVILLYNELFVGSRDVTADHLS